MKHVYIILSQTGTWFSSALRFYTKDPYNHASLAFTRDLNVMYSFGRKSRYNFLNSGFVEEQFSCGIYRYFPNTRCCILAVEVTDAEYDAMYKEADEFCRNQGQYKYNLLGVMGNAFGIGITRRNHFFCSQFVSHILRKTAFWNGVPEFTKPMDFFTIPHAQKIFEGSIQNLNPEITQLEV